MKSGARMKKVFTIPIISVFLWVAFGWTALIHEYYESQGRSNPGLVKMGSFYAKGGVVNEKVDGVRVKTELYTQTDRVNVRDTVTYAPVSKPATMMLLGAGLIGLAGFGRKRILKKK